MKYYILLLCLIVHKISYAIEYSTSAKQAILIDATTGQILFENNADELMHPSSMTKIMTTYLAFDALKNGKISMSTRFTTSEKAWRMQGSRMFLNYGDTPTVDELLKGIVVQSGNDACVVIAEGLAGTEEAFVQKMNAMAKKLNMNSTNFTNASGWPDPNNLSTAKDLSKLAIALIRNFPEYYHYHQMQKFSYGNIMQNNRNTLLGKFGVNGIKTGHTEAGGYGVVLSAENQNKKLIAVINGLQSDKDRAQEGAKILNYGFANFVSATVLRNDKILAKSNVRYGAVPFVNLKVKENLNVLTNSESVTMQCTMTYDSNIQAPIFIGQKLGSAKCNIKNIFLDYITVDLIAAEQVQKANFLQRIIQNLEYIF